MSSLTLPSKIDVAKQLLEKGSLFIHLDPRTQDVIVPPWLRHQAQLVLQVGTNMPIPIDDLNVNQDGIFGTLTFSRSPFTCILPWAAIFALVGDEQRGMVWPESMPSEIAAEVAREEDKMQNRSSSSIPPLPPEAAKKASPRVSTKKALPPYLRVIK